MRARFFTSLTGSLLVALVACGDDDGGGAPDATTPPPPPASDPDATTPTPPPPSSDPDATTPTPPPPPHPPGAVPATVGGSRPARVVAPSDWAGDTALPLVVLLHGYGASAALQDAYFQLSAQVDERRFVLILPDGTMSASGRRFWNATSACCDFDGSGVDDVAYLMGLVDEIEGAVAIDAARVYFVGHSNGGFMSHRLACDAADRVTAIVSLAGSTFANESQCSPARAVSILQIHGTADDTIQYGGVAFGYPGAVEIIERAATRAGCDLSAAETGDPIDLDTSLDGAETSVTTYATGCSAGTSAALWTIAEGAHIPGLGATFAPTILDWLFAHPG